MGNGLWHFLNKRNRNFNSISGYALGLAWLSGGAPKLVDFCRVKTPVYPLTPILYGVYFAKNITTYCVVV
jgi:hypothetical protein